MMNLDRRPSPSAVLASALFSSSTTRPWIVVSLLSLSFLGLCVTRDLAAADPVRPLPKEDQERLEKGLGKGVIGKAVPAPTIKDPASFCGVQPGKFNYRITFGKGKGATQSHVLTKLKSIAGSDSWKMTLGSKHVKYLTTTKDGSIELVSDQDNDEGVITRYSPPQPLWKSNWKPGDVTKLKVDVKVYKLADPKEVSHSGYFNVTYTYVGAYEVNVPAGKFQASLLKWEYKGKIGPASVEDVRYGLLAKGVGPVAVIEKLDVSAFLVYQDHTKSGMVLVKRDK